MFSRPKVDGQIIRFKTCAELRDLNSSMWEIWTCCYFHCGWQRGNCTSTFRCL